MTTEETVIAPSILACDFGRLFDEVQAVTDAGADWIHADVMDGHFVPNITIGPRIVEAVRDATQLPVDVHLMIQQPERHIDAFVKAGATTVGISHGLDLVRYSIFRNRRVIARFLQEVFGDPLVLFGEHSAGTVDERAPGSQHCGRVFDERPLDLGEARRISRSDPPFCVGVAAERTEPRARGVHEDPVEAALGREFREGARRIPGDGSNPGESEAAHRPLHEVESAGVAVDRDDGP